MLLLIIKPFMKKVIH